MSTEDFIMWSGWICTVVSTAIAIWQTLQKEKYKKLSQEINVGDRKETYKAKKKGIAMRNNSGDITIN